MKKIIFLWITLTVSVSTMQAGLPPEFSVTNADGVMISYAKCDTWVTDCNGNSVLVTWREDDVEYAGEVIIPESVIHEGITYSVIGIAPGVAFVNCPELTGVGIPESAYYVDYYAFSGSSNLKDIYVAWPDPAEVSIGSSSFYGIHAGNINLHVPVGAKALYESNPIWNVFHIVDDGRTAGDNSNIARLSSLAVSAGILSPAFSPTTLSYRVYVGRNVENITLTALAAYGGTVSGDMQKSLGIGENTMEITVTSADGTLQKTYTVTVIRLEVNPAPCWIEEGTPFITYAGSIVYIEGLQMIIGYDLKFRIRVGNHSGDLPLVLNMDGIHLETTLRNIQPNYEYTLTIPVNISNGIDSSPKYLYYDVVYSFSNAGMPTEFHKRVIGRAASLGSLVLTEVGPTSISEVSAESARPIGYYSLQGQRLAKEPASGLYIIQYSDGTARTVLRPK